MPIIIEIIIKLSSDLAQNRAVVAGRTIIPIDIKVPNARKPATKFITIRNKKP